VGDEEGRSAIQTFVRMIPTILVFLYLAVVRYPGIFAFRRGKTSREDYFLASRSLGNWVFLLSLFGTNMTAFAILGSSGLAYQRGIGVYGLMASASGFVIPLTIFFIGTRLWALGKKFGHMTQVQYFRDRWECSAIGTLIFALTAAMLVPYIIIGVMGGGQTLEALSTIMGSDGQPQMFEVMRNGQTVLAHRHWISYEAGGGLVALVVMSYVFFGGMRGTAWVNTFQTVLFLCFGTLAFILVGHNLGGFDKLVEALAANPKTALLLTRQRIPVEEFFSYTFIPLSSIMFPHIAIMCMTAKKASAFKKTVIFYPLCIMLIWVPSVFLGVLAAGQFPGLTAGESDDVILRLLTEHTHTIVAGVLGAAIMACVMASDSQILALCTMFTEDVFAYYGGKKKFGETAQVWTGRAFVVGVTLLAYLMAIEHLANVRGCSCYFVDLDPRWVKKVLANRQFEVARAYMDHVVDQAITILKHRRVSALFTTPKLLETLSEKINLYEAGVRDVFCGGTSMMPQCVRFLIEEVLENRIGFAPTYGNTLMGLAASRPLRPEAQFSITYYAPQPRAVLRIVNPDQTDQLRHYGEWGRVELTTLTKEFFMPRFLGRDEAIRREPCALYPWDGVGDVRPFGAMEKQIIEGVY
jgi:Na+/proline symporter